MDGKAEDTDIQEEIRQFVPEENRTKGHTLPILESPHSADRITLEYEDDFRDDEPHEANDTDCEGRPAEMLNGKYSTIETKHGEFNDCNCTTEENLAYIYVLPHRISAMFMGYA